MTSPDEPVTVTRTTASTGQEPRSRGWVWPVDTSSLDQSALTTLEVAALHQLGSDVRRQPGYGQHSLVWRRVCRLSDPLDLARDDQSVDEGDRLERNYQAALATRTALATECKQLVRIRIAESQAGPTDTNLLTSQPPTEEDPPPPH